MKNILTVPTRATAQLHEELKRIKADNAIFRETNLGLCAKIRFLLSYANIEEFTFPDGDTWRWEDK